MKQWYLAKPATHFVSHVNRVSNSHVYMPGSVVFQRSSDVYYYILLLFVALPLVELVLLKSLWDATSLPATIALVLATGFLGATLARMQGMSAWRKIHESMAGGRQPGPELVDGAMVVLAGAVLITPGLITDCVGFALLVPWVRQRLGKWGVEAFKKRTLAKFKVHKSGGASAQSEPQPEPTVIDAEFTRVD